MTRVRGVVEDTCALFFQGDVWSMWVSVAVGATNRVRGAVCAVMPPGRQPQGHRPHSAEQIRQAAASTDQFHS